MSRRDRLILLVSYFVAVALLLALFGALGAWVGPLEMIGVLLVAVPVSLLVARAFRSLVLRDARRA